MVGPARPGFVLFGSSIVQLSFSHGGWGSILSHIYARKADIILRGYYGWNSRRALQVLNQVFPKVPLPEYIDNMRRILLHLQSLSQKTCVIVLTCPPVNEAKVRGNNSAFLSEVVRTNELCQSYSEACIKLCKEMDVKVVDLFTALQKRDDWMNTCFTDGIHLSAEGSKIVVEEILKVLKQAEWKPCLHWKSMPTEFAQDSPYDLVAADGKNTLNPSEWTFRREIQWD